MNTKYVFKEGEIKKTISEKMLKESIEGNYTQIFEWIKLKVKIFFCEFISIIMNSF